MADNVRWPFDRCDRQTVVVVVVVGVYKVENCSAVTQTRLAGPLYQSVPWCPSHSHHHRHQSHVTSTPAWSHDQWCLCQHWSWDPQPDTRHSWIWRQTEGELSWAERQQMCAVWPGIRAGGWGRSSPDKGNIQSEEQQTVSCSSPSFCPCFHTLKVGVSCTGCTVFTYIVNIFNVDVECIVVYWILDTGQLWSISLIRSERVKILWSEWKPKRSL